MFWLFDELLSSVRNNQTRQTTNTQMPIWQGGRILTLLINNISTSKPYLSFTGYYKKIDKMQESSTVGRLREWPGHPALSALYDNVVSVFWLPKGRDRITLPRDFAKSVDRCHRTPYDAKGRAPLKQFIPLVMSLYRAVALKLWHYLA